MTLFLRLLGTLLLLLAGMGGGFAAAARAENSRRQLHSFARLLTYLAELLDAQAQIGAEGWEGVTVIDYDGIIPYAADFTDLPMELEEFNAFTKAARDIPRSEVPKLKALLEQYEVRDIETAMFLTEHQADYILMPNLSSPQEAALDQLCFIMDREEAVRLIPYVNLFNYGETVIHADNAALTSYGLLHRADYEPMLSPIQQKQEKEMTMQ